MPFDLSWKFAPLTLTVDPASILRGEIAGYGAIFGTADLDGDIIVKGAFDATLANRAAPVAMLKHHDPQQIVGTWSEIRADKSGLRCKGQLLTTTDCGEVALEEVKAGALSGLSIGYRTVKAEGGPNGTRRLTEVELWEVSLVTFPMHVGARIDSLKAAGLTERDFERMLMQDAGFSRSVARALMAGGLKAVQRAKQDAGGETEALVRALRARAAL